MPGSVLNINHTFIYILKIITQIPKAPKTEREDKLYFTQIKNFHASKDTTKEVKGGWVWWSTPVIPAFTRLRQEGCSESRASLGSLKRPCLTKPKSKKTNNPHPTKGRVEFIAWEKNTVSQVFDKDSVSGIYKDLLQLNKI